jgi:hypothetical protein
MAVRGAEGERRFCWDGRGGERLKFLGGDIDGLVNVGTE